jgi:hypothetical protein
VPKKDDDVTFGLAVSLTEESRDLVPPLPTFGNKILPAENKKKFCPSHYLTQ